MSSDRETLIQQLCDPGGAYRVSELQRAYKFHELLRKVEPTFYGYLKDAMLGKKPEEATPGDRGVRAAASCELGVTLACELNLAAGGAEHRYVGRAFALCVEGKDLKGNASLEKHHHDELLWKLVTNETWPTRVEHFIRRGRSLRAEVHVKQLESLARTREVSIPAGLLDGIFRPIDARLYRLYQVLRAS